MMSTISNQAIAAMRDFEQRCDGIFDKVSLHVITMALDLYILYTRSVRGFR